MPKLLQNLSEIMCDSERQSLSSQQFITIGNQLFAVARSSEEMAQMMRINHRKVTGYVLQHRM